MSRSSTPVDEKSQNELSKVPESAYPSNSKRLVVMVSLYLAVFLITLDQNIIATAIPKITDEFHSLDDIGWYGTAYLLTMCSFTLLMGKIYKFYPVKIIFLCCCGLFEVGSAICGAAPTSTAFIIGRAVAGLGASGLVSGAMVIMFCVVPLQQRPIYQGIFGAVFAVASVIGPLIGGTFTDKVTWRWCFYINLPIGAVSILVTTFILHLSDQKLEKPAEGWIGKVKQLDPLGNLAFFPGIICLILALQWGGAQYAWSDARIVVLLVLCVVLCAVFVGIQIWKKEAATVPPRIVTQRSMAGAIWFGFCNGTAMMVVTYYLPVWFQAIKGVSAIQSGIMLLPMILTCVIGGLSSGIIVSKVGYYTPFFYISSVITPIGAGLLTTFTPNTGEGMWIGYQILLGFGLGMGMQQPMLVAQTILGKADIATGTAVVMFARFLGPAIFLSVAENIFLNDLVYALTSFPGISPEAVINGGATALRKLATGDNLDALLAAYNGAIIKTFYLVVAMCGATIFGSVVIEWRNLKTIAEAQAKEAGASNKMEETV